MSSGYSKDEPKAKDDYKPKVEAKDDYKEEAKKSAKSEVPRDFPRILYHYSGEQQLWNSAAEFDAADDGLWAQDPLTAQKKKD